MPHIPPTPGRVVWFYPGKHNAESDFVYHNNRQPLAALVAHVWNDRMVNLAVFDSNGNLKAVTSVPLLQDSDEVPALGFYACWMPYQKGQAAKTEQIEQDKTLAIAAAARAAGPSGY